MNSNEMENKSNEKKTNENKLNFLDILGGLLIFISTICLIVVFVCSFCTRPKIAVPSEITIVIQADSTGVLETTSQQKIDSLIAIVKQQDTFVRERYALLVEQKEKENRLITFAGIIISIILGIFGFFGYRSFKSIEEQAVSNADEKAQKKVNTEMVTIQNTLEKELIGSIDKRFNKEYQERLGKEVGKKMNENYNEAISAKLNYIDNKEKAFEDIQKRVGILEQFISQLQDEGLTIKITPPSEKGDIKEFANERKESKSKVKPDKKKGDE